jgi:hypothetical protein
MSCPGYRCSISLHFIKQSRQIGMVRPVYFGKFMTMLNASDALQQSKNEGITEGFLGGCQTFENGKNGREPSQEQNATKHPQ